MTVSAAEPAVGPQRPVSGHVSDALVPFAEASKTLRRSTDALRQWHDAGHLPAVITPGGQWMTFQSFIAAVLASPRPSQAGDIAAIGRAWFATHPADEAVA